jgi:tetratricopeptide (TPR) repeat protein
VKPVVHENHLRGLYHWNRRTSRDLQLALGYFKRAIEEDSTYAPAWVGLSDTYGLLPQYDVVDEDESMAKARAAALKAVELDSTLAAAYASLGNVEKSWTHDWNEAERYYRKAIELNPGYATAHHWYAVLLVWQGNVPNGLAEIERARHLDPLSPVIQLTLARICYLTRDYARAVREYEQALELDPNRTSAWRGLSGVLFQQGRCREASAAWERGIALLPDSIGLRSSPALTTTASEYLDRRLTTTLRLSRYRLASPAELAAVYSELGAKDAAFKLLEGARPDQLVLGDLRALPDYDGLRSDPRYSALEARLVARQSSTAQRPRH